MTSSVTWLSIRSREFFWLLGTVVCLSISGCVFHCLCLPVVVSSLSFSDSEFLSLWVCFFVSLWVCLSVTLPSLSLFLMPPPPPPPISCLARAKLFRQVLTESNISVGGRGGGLKRGWRAWSQVCSHGNMMGEVGQGDDFKGSVVLAQGFIYTEIWNFWKQRYWEKWSHKKNGLSLGIEELVAVEMHSQSCLASTRDWKVRVAQLCFSRLSSRKGQWICNGNSYQLGHCGKKMWWISNCIMQNTDVYMYLQALRCVFCISHSFGRFQTGEHNNCNQPHWQL